MLIVNHGPSFEVGYTLANIGGETMKFWKIKKIENNSEPIIFDLDLSYKYFNWVIKIEWILRSLDFQSNGRTLF